MLKQIKFYTPLHCLALTFRAGLALAALQFLISGSSWAASAVNYEIWALDQGTNQVHIYSSALKEVHRIDLAAKGVRTAHMIDFTSNGAYALIASTGSGDVTLVRTSDRTIVGQLATGPGTHMATVGPDDRVAIVAVIGDPKAPGTGKLVEVRIDGAKPSFTLGRSLVISEDPFIKQKGARFKDTRPVCQEFTAAGRYAYVTLGPALENGGVVVLDTRNFTLVAAYPPDEVRANCGTVRTNDGRRMIVNGGGADVGIWYVFDTTTHKVIHQADSRGKDAHGVWPVPDGSAIWMVNRVSSNAIVIDPTRFGVIDEIKFVGKTPDIIAMTPDSRYAFISLRGPKPLTAPHVAVGETPGFAVIDLRTRKLVRTIEPAKGESKSDFHGIGVRILRR
jgi:DNA-binding beta-propeller fold protein YncE